MMGVALSRWTMAYFAAALLALLAGEALLLAGFGYPSAGLRAPETLFVVHLLALGWLSLLMCGALFQFVPVLIAHSLHSDRLPLPTLLLLLGGLLLLLAGFLQLAGLLPARFLLLPLLLPWGGGLLLAGFLLALYNLGRTLWSARPLVLPARFVVVALLSLLAAALLGFLFTLSFASLLENGALARIASLGLPLHVVAALGGWLSFAAIGVSYRLLAMFMLAPELDGGRPRALLWLGTLALAVVILGGVGQLLLAGSDTLALGLALALAVVGIGLYAADVRRLYRERKRPVIELNSQMAAFAVVALVASTLLLLGLLLAGRLAGHVAAVVFLFAFGWLSGLGLAKLYKITAFLTWLECYGPILGRKPTPRVQDLVVEPKARGWFFAYHAGVWLGTLALLSGFAPGFRAAAGLMLVATAAIVRQLWRIRRLDDVKETIRLADLVARPKLLLVAPQERPAR